MLVRDGQLLRVGELRFYFGEEIYGECVICTTKDKCFILESRLKHAHHYG
jgi:hypothetical protein